MYRFDATWLSLGLSSISRTVPSSRASSCGAVSSSGIEQASSSVVPDRLPPFNLPRQSPQYMPSLDSFQHYTVYFVLGLPLLRSRRVSSVRGQLPAGPPGRRSALLAAANTPGKFRMRKMQPMACRGKPLCPYHWHGSGDPFRPQWRSIRAHRRTKDLALFIQSLRRIAVGILGTQYGIC